MSDTDEIEMRIGLYPQSIHPLFRYRICRWCESGDVVTEGLCAECAAPLGEADIAKLWSLTDPDDSELGRDDRRLITKLIGNYIRLRAIIEAGSEHAEEAKP